MIENDEENRGIFVSLSNTQKLDLGRCSVAFHQSNRGSSLETGPTESINMWGKQPYLKSDLATPMHTKQPLCY